MSASGQILFDEINAAALSQLPSLLREWFPHGKRIGHEWRVGSIDGEAGDSFSINMQTGEWAEFNGMPVKGRDVIGLYAAKFCGGNRVEAAKSLGARLGFNLDSERKSNSGEHWVPMIPPPQDAGKPPDAMRKNFDVVYCYTSLQDRETHYVGRIEARGNERKKFTPITYGTLTKNGSTTTSWHKRAPDPPRPLYGLNKLTAMPDAVVILCEGEQKTDAAQRMFPEHACLSWFGGTGQVDDADVAPLATRQVIVWPDADQPGLKAVGKLLPRLPPDTQTVDVHDLPDAFDAADLEQDGEDPEAWLKARLRKPEPPDLGTWDASTIDPAAIPPRGWLLGNSFCRGFLSSLIADGGVGKTALRIAQALALAAGRNLTDEHVFVRPCRVLLVSLEDDRNELNRRIAAALIYHGITPDEVRDRLILAAPKKMKLLEMQDGSITAGKLKAWLDAVIAAHKPDLVILDPLVKTHALEENSNAMMDIVCDHLAALAIEKDIAIDVPHHTKKGTQTPGNADQGRGASAIKDATRISDTLTPMSGDEANQFDIDPHERTSYVRFDSGKHNLCPARQAKWFHLVSAPIGNPSPIYPVGDHIQTMEVWIPPSLWQDTDTPTLNRILDRIDAGLPNGSRYSDAPNAKDRAAWRVVADLLREKTDKQAREIINTWVKNGVLVVEDYYDQQDHKDRKGLRVVTAKRPS